MNKRIFTVVVAALVAGVVTTTWAGPKCCPASKQQAKTTAKSADCEKGGSCWDVFAKLDLTADQKAKLAELKGDCDKTGCSYTSRQKMISGVKSILTPEQQEQCKTQCAEKGVKDCPMQSAGKDGAAEKKS